jgi:hypothetical protein
MAWAVSRLPRIVGAGATVEAGFYRIVRVRHTQAVGEAGLVVEAARRDEGVGVTSRVTTGRLAVGEEALLGEDVGGEGQEGGYEQRTHGQGGEGVAGGTREMEEKRRRRAERKTLWRARRPRQAAPAVLCAGSIESLGPQIAGHSIDQAVQDGSVEDEGWSWLKRCIPYCECLREPCEGQVARPCRAGAAGLSRRDGAFLWVEWHGVREAMAKAGGWCE